MINNTLYQISGFLAWHGYYEEDHILGGVMFVNLIVTHFNLACNQAKNKNYMHSTKNTYTLTTGFLLIGIIFGFVDCNSILKMPHVYTRSEYKCSQKLYMHYPNLKMAHFFIIKSTAPKCMMYTYNIQCRIAK